MSVLDNVNLAKIRTSLPVANQYFQFMTRKMIKKADELLYQVKKMGGNRMNTKDSILNWYPYEKAMEEYDNEEE